MSALLGLLGATSLLGSAFNYFSTKATNKTNYNIHKEDNAFNRVERELAQAYNTQMTDPSYLVERGRRAGINRMASLGLPTSSIAPASAGSPIAMETPQMDFNGAITSAATADREIADAGLTREQTLGTSISNSYLAQKEYAGLIQSLAEIDKLKIDADEAKARKEYIITQMKHLEKMSPLMQAGQESVNRMNEQEREESIQRVAESKARVANEAIRVALEKQKVQSELKVNAAQAKQLLAAAENLSWKSANIQFRADFDQRKQAFFENYQTAETYLRGMSANAQVWLLKNQAALAGVELEKLARENDSDFNKFLQQNIGIDSKEFLNLSPNVVVPIGKFHMPK